MNGGSNRGAFVNAFPHAGGATRRLVDMLLLQSLQSSSADPGLFMNRSAFFKTHVCKRSYGYLAQNTAQISRYAIACGSLEVHENRRLSPGG